MDRMFAAEIESFRFRGAAQPALKGVQFALNPGESLVVRGAGGSGKTTLAHCLSGAIPGFYRHGSFSGSVQLGEVNISTAPLAQAARLVGLMLQNPERQMFHLSLAEDLAFGPENLNLPHSEILQRVRESAEVMNIGHLLHRAPSTLSSGETQRAALAATLALQPPVLVFDQPTANLDREGRELFYRHLRFLTQTQRRVVVIAETDVRSDDLPSLATQHICLPAGSRGETRSEAECDLWPEPAITGIRDSTPVIRIRNLTFAHAGCPPLLSSAEMSLAAGECAVVLGANGSGKTTLLRLIAGLLKPQEGSIELAGRDFVRDSAAQRSRFVAYLPQECDALLWHDTVRGELACAYRGRHGVEDGRPEAALSVLGLAGSAAAHPLTLSAGERYRLALGVLLARGPRLLLLDEPTSILDKAETGLVCKLLRRYCSAGGSALIVTHEPDRLAQSGLHHKVINLNHHRLIQASSSEDANQS